ncbi:hypothetical protein YASMINEVIRUS_354 [Yasminevirus sp. GU-2018]|uniref:Uncharacterized protein n=1 Tax=Yasminevirus sp. GU-2018 TaxID=2420051 RepID=A0A5K0U8N6_9VIRU|nr:hypothetical protein YASMINEVIRUS_354 [Yasminevirus sp. GU-2018]
MDPNTYDKQTEDSEQSNRYVPPPYGQGFNQSQHHSQAYPQAYTVPYFYTTAENPSHRSYSLYPEPPYAYPMQTGSAQNERTQEIHLRDIPPHTTIPVQSSEGVTGTTDRSDPPTFLL